MPHRKRRPRLPEDAGTLVRFGYHCGAIAVLDAVRIYLPPEVIADMDDWLDEVSQWAEGPAPQPPGPPQAVAVSWPGAAPRDLYLPGWS